MFKYVVISGHLKTIFLPKRLTVDAFTERGGGEVGYFSTSYIKRWSGKSTELINALNEGLMGVLKLSSDHWHLQQEDNYTQISTNNAGLPGYGSTRFHDVL